MKGTVKVEWHGAEALAAVDRAVINGITETANYMVLVARNYAPKSQRVPGRRANKAPDVAVEAIRKGDTRQRRGDVSTVTGRLERAESLADFTFRVKPMFKGKPQRRAGEIVSPESVFVSRGRLVTGGAHQPGTLKKSIRLVGIQRTGHTFTATVRAGVKYARPVEYGFRHRGGRKKTGKTTLVAKKPFMRPAMNLAARKLKSPATFKG